MFRKRRLGCGHGEKRSGKMVGRFEQRRSGAERAQARRGFSRGRYNLTLDDMLVREVVTKP